MSKHAFIYKSGRSTGQIDQPIYKYTALPERLHFPPQPYNSGLRSIPAGS